MLFRLTASFVLVVLLSGCVEMPRRVADGSYSGGHPKTRSAMEYMEKAAWRSLSYEGDRARAINLFGAIGPAESSYCESGTMTYVSSKIDISYELLISTETIDHANIFALNIVRIDDMNNMTQLTQVLGWVPSSGWSLISGEGNFSLNDSKE
jgi:hypothetical protein